MELGPRIAAWRKHRGLSQRKLAALIEVTPQAVCMWESGASWRNLPSTKNLNKLVAALGLTMQRFYGPPPGTKRPRKEAA
jgi:transcriptional regulator with XRE-family HTH domain